MSKEIFITTVSKEEYKNLTEREKSIYDAGVKEGAKRSPTEVFILLILITIWFFVGYSAGIKII
jgi:hypothetical protein